MGGSRVIRVTNIAPQATRDQMQTLFQFVGKVEEIKLYPTIRDVAIPVASRVSFVKFFDRDHVGIAQHLNNTVFIDRALIIVPYEKSDIPDEHSAMQALVQSNGALGVTNEQQLPAHVTNIVDGAYYITSDPTFAERGLPEYPSLTCTLEYGQVEEIRRTVMVGNLAPSTDAAKVMEWIGDAGEIKYARMCGRDTDDSRACLIEFSEQASVIPALLKSGQKMGDRALKVGHASLGIAKPQIKTNEMAQREIEEAMRRAQEQQSLINSTMQPVTSYMDETRRSRSRDRSARRRRSRSRDRRRGGRSRSRSPRRSRSRYSPARDRRRSRSRDRKSRSRRSRSRSRDRSRRSRHRTRSRSRDRKKDDKDRRGSSRDKDRKDKDKDKDRDKDRSRSDKDKDKDRSRDKDKSSRSKDEDSHAKESRKTDSPAKEKSSKESSSRARSRSRSPAKKRSRSRSSDRRRGGRGGGRSSPVKRRSRSRSKDRRASKRVSRSPAPVRKRSRSPPPRASHSSRSARSPEPKRRDRDRDHKRDKDRREKESSKSEKSDAKISRDYDEEEKGFDEDTKKSPSRDVSPAGKRSKEDRSAPAGADDMDISD